MSSVVDLLYLIGFTFSMGLDHLFKVRWMVVHLMWSKWFCIKKTKTHWVVTLLLCFTHWRNRVRNGRQECFWQTTYIRSWKSKFPIVDSRCLTNTAVTGPAILSRLETAQFVFWNVCSLSVERIGFVDILCYFSLTRTHVNTLISPPNDLHCCSRDQTKGRQ